MENIAQTAAARAGYSPKENHRQPAIGYIGSVKDLFIYALPEINENIETEITVLYFTPHRNV